MYFSIEDDDLWKKYITIWDNVRADIKKELDSKPAYNNFFKKTKTKSYAEEVSGFYSKETPKLNSNHTCLAVISLDPALNKDGSYYSQGFLKGCKDIKKKVIKHIIDNLSDLTSDDDSKEE